MITITQTSTLERRGPAVDPRGQDVACSRGRVSQLLTALVVGCGLALLAAPVALAQNSKATAVFGDDIASLPQTTQAIDRALSWLADQQNEDGSWTGSVGFKVNQSYEVEKSDVPHVGVTALAGMAFLAGGHLPGRGRYGVTISRATDFVLACVDPTSGFIQRNGTRMYSHAFATLYLAEVVGMTQRADLRDKLQRSVDLIVQSQNAVGSWRYEPFAVESDMSITVCQLMALRAARNIGIKVPKSTIDLAVEYVRDSYIQRDQPPAYWYVDEYYFMRKGGFRYQMQDHTRSSFAVTAAGIASMYNAGVYSHETLQDSLEVLKDTYPKVSNRQDHYFFWYGNYYAVQAMYVAGGQWWDWYYGQISTDLLQRQSRDGYWLNREGPGNAFSTAIGAIILQVPYKYLPILQR